MKIIAGKLKGKKIITLDGLSTRPTLNRIKENIFNIMLNYCSFEDKIVVDLFAGSGNLILESLSRGAKFAFANDINKAACNIINQNCFACNLQEQVKLSNLDYQIFSKTLVQQCDIVFIDPPFVNITCQQWIIDFFYKNNLLANNALIVLETNVPLENLQLNFHFKVVSNKKYGKIYIKIIQFYEK
ncbi:MULTISPECIES: RsmD family RNA methyltransferase [unclassified Spiroplasma]|uniref:RsmD family RNA methyltransferase n=1 Tax=unclassified Spiroplasma TaxID=2637901 RepID=UPI0027A938BE|nr:MAG: RsmD family RNA methyltransferase [Spiroplasma endosymbiont of Drosophila atripex]